MNKLVDMAVLAGKIIDLKIPIPAKGYEGQYLKAIGTLKRNGDFCFQTTTGRVFSFRNDPAGRLAKMFFVEHICSFV